MEGRKEKEGCNDTEWKEEKGRKEGGTMTGRMDARTTPPQTHNTQDHPSSGTL
jgi:hypothetical protein